MSPSGGREIKCDLGAMEELGRQLHRIHGNLADPSHEIDAHGCMYGSEKIENALEDFIKGWKDGRKEILDSLTEVVGKLEGATKAYEEQENRMVAAAQGKTEP